MRVSAKWLSIRLVQVIFNFPEFVSKCCTYNVASACPLFGSHNLMGCWLSLLPDTISAFCGCQCTHFTSAPWPLLLIFNFKVKIRIQINTIVRHSALIKHLPLSTRSSWQRKKSQTRSVPSSLHVTNLLSDGLKLWKFQLNIYFSKSSSSFLFILFIYSCYCSFIPCHPKIPSIFNCIYWFIRNIPSHLLIRILQLWFYLEKQERTKQLSSHWLTSLVMSIILSIFFFGLNMSAIGRTGTDASILHFNQSLFHSICIYFFLFQILFGSKKWLINKLIETQSNKYILLLFFFVRFSPHSCKLKSHTGIWFPCSAF